MSDIFFRNEKEIEWLIFLYQVFEKEGSLCNLDSQLTYILHGKFHTCLQFSCASIGSFWNHIHTITYKSRLTQKKLHKKTDAIFSIYGKNGIIPWHFFWILSWAFQGRWGRMKMEVEFLRLRPRNFAIIPDTFSPHLRMVRYTSVYQTVPKFWFIWLCYISFCITYKSTVN
jgi:hypothetical protein